jgi:hypothetical protein
MNDRYRLGGLDDVQLLASLSALVKRENDSLSDLLAHLAELDQRELCVARGYSSLFAYCTEALGFCKSSAGRRIAAARVCRAYPEAFTRVANGELQLFDVGSWEREQQGCGGHWGAIGRRGAAGRFGALAEGMLVRRARGSQLAVRTISWCRARVYAVAKAKSGVANTTKSSAVVLIAS